MKTKQNGFTAVELLMVLAVVGILAVAGIGLYVAVHFISKFW
jgi:prepilin-type N-terminal cleavage/methylation domain-containing protein